MNVLSPSRDMPAELVDAINGELRAGRKVVPFVGAAISLFEPTSLPSWFGFIQIVLESLEELVPESAGYRVSRQVIDDVWAGRLKPFQVTEALASRLGSQYLGVMESLMGHEPNHVHRWLADGMVTGSFPAIITTNFDRAIEDAIKRTGVLPLELTGDPVKDKEMLDEQLKTDESIHVVVVAKQDAFKFIAQFPSIIGSPRHAFIFKLHGDAGYPETCVDTTQQRLQGLSSPMLHLLSIMLQRFTFFFIGFGGGDLEMGVNYLRLEAERDTARIHWLMRPNDAEPPVFQFLSEMLADRFQVIRSTIHGSVGKQNDIIAGKVKAWARNIGDFWARLVLDDLHALSSPNQRDPAFKQRVLLPVLGGQGLLAPENVLESGFHITKAISRRTDMLGTAPLIAAIACKTNDAIHHISTGDFGLAMDTLNAATRDIKRDFKDIRLCPDAWIINCLIATIATCTGDYRAAWTLVEDARDIALMSGQSEGIGLCNEMLLVLGENSDQLGHRTEEEATVDKEQGNDKGAAEILVFIPAFDNVQPVYLGIPQSIYLKALFNRALLTGDKVVLGPNFLLNSRVFIMEVLFEHGILDETYLSLIRPMLPVAQMGIDFKGDEHPLLTYRRRAQVEKKDFLHETIDDTFIAKIDLFFKERPESMYWYDFSSIANTYGSRTRKLLEMQDACFVNGPGDTTGARECIPHVLEFVKACMASGPLFRSQLYKYGNLFRTPTTASEFQEEITKLLGGREHECCKSGEKLREARESIVLKPWRSTELVKTIADCAYVTNLPLAFGFSLSIDDQNALLFDLIMPIIKEERGTRMLEKFKVFSNIRVLELARLQSKDVLAIRNSPQGKRYRERLRELGEGRISHSDPSVEKDMEAYSDLINGSLVKPEARPVPCLHVTSQIKAINTALLERLIMVVPKSSPLPPMYDIPSVEFPGLISVIQRTENREAQL